jgi:WD40 repeat protein
MGSAHCGAVWCCRFSGCGRLLATCGQDRLLRVWVTRDAHHMFQVLLSLSLSLTFQYYICLIEIQCTKYLITFFVV